MKHPLLSLALLALVGVVSVSGHGLLYDPPSRSSMWRHGFDTPVNYNDNELFCGGFEYQMKMGYKCGVCGDPYDGPRDNEPGGKYATGIIADTYTQGQKVTLEVHLTANHKGFFEFKICPTNAPDVNATQECLDLHPLKLVDTGETRYPIDFHGPRKVKLPVFLPADLTCSYCVIQWRYHTGNSWGTDPDGRSCLGCGPQEEFYGCADVRILPGGDDSKVNNEHQTEADSLAKDLKHNGPNNNNNVPSLNAKNNLLSSQKVQCQGVSQVGVAKVPDEWCTKNCQELLS